MTDPLASRFLAENADLDPSGRPRGFGDPASELRSALETCALAERSSLGRVRAIGPDMLDLLHRLSTQDLRALAPGEGREAVLTTGKGRIVERIVVHHLGADGVLVLAGEEGAGRVRAHLDRYTFSENTGILESRPERLLALVGPRASGAAEAAGAPLPPPLGVVRWHDRGFDALVLGHAGDASDGLSFLVPEEQVGAAWDGLARATVGLGGRAAGDEAMVAWRILRGVPTAGRELTEEHNPLEAGLWNAVSFTKGCYVGQEVIARLRTYERVSRTLVGILLPPDAAAPTAGAELMMGARSVGAVTSAVLPPGRRAPVALAYVKRNAANPGTVLALPDPAGPTDARVSSLPFGPTP